MRSGPPSTRWPFFSSHPEPHLAEAASRGRIEEFATYGWDTAEMLDPQDPLAFQTAKLNWSELSAAPHRNMLALYRRLIELRRTEPDLQDSGSTAVAVDYDEAARWLVVHRGGLRIAANFDEAPQVVPGLAGEVVLATGEVKARRQRPLARRAERSRHPSPLRAPLRGWGGTASATRRSSAG